MKLIIDIPDELFNIFKKHGIMAFDYFNEYDKDTIARIIAHGTPYNPSGDAISREDLKKAIREYAEPSSKLSDDFSRGMTECACEILDMIDNAPTVPQVTVFTESTDEKAVADMKAELQNKLKDPQGEWEIEDAEGLKIWNCVCTECGHDPQEYIGGTENWWLRKHHLPNFCPNCGVRIVNVKGGAE